MPEKTGVYLGLDYGRKRIGIAVGQPLTGSATPLDQITVTQQPDWQHIANLIEEWCPRALVVGLPLNMDDSESKMSTAARRFAEQLRQRFGLPVYLIDERLSTREATARLQAQDKQRHNKKQLNSMAAAVILESWLQQENSHD